MFKFKQALVSIFAIVPSVFVAAPTIHADDVHCSYSLGFGSIAAMIPNTVGGCLTNPVGLGNGDVAQQTTQGQMIWHRDDNLPRFMDGTTGSTWVLGPQGLQARPFDQRFSYEASQSVVAGITIGPPGADTESCLANYLMGKTQPVPGVVASQPVNLSVTLPVLGPGCPAS